MSLNVADAVVSGGITLTVLTISWAGKALFSRDREKAAARKDVSDALARDHETWREDFNHAYGQIKAQCDSCMDAFYGLLDDLEGQILPMLILPQANPRETARAVRVCMDNARRRVRNAAN